MPFRRIVHPTDFSSASTKAFRLAVDLAKAGRARLVLLHVLSVPATAFAADVPVPPAVYTELEATARANAS